MSTRTHYGIGAFIDTSRTGSGTATTPAAGAAFVTIASVPAGFYKAEVIYTITGTAETGVLNVRLNRATDGGVIDLPSTPGAFRFTVDAFRVSASQSVQLRAVALATTGAIYSGSLSLTRIG